jgi:acyl-CoA reductase-like NAD-dependent aldehyde dehydrogenase
MTEIPRIQMFVDGKWADALNGRTFPDRNPWDDGVLASVPAGDADDAVEAVDAAARAFPAWADSSPAERQRVFLTAADVVERRAAEIRRLLAVETGCGVSFADVQVRFAATLFRQAAGLAYAPLGDVLASDLPGTSAVARRRPVGVVGAITPWNAAVSLSARALAVPLAVGNCVVLKPSEESPWSGGVLFAEILAEAGLPPGVLNVVTHAPGEAGGIADVLVGDQRVRRLNFTGSTATGRRLAGTAGRHLKHLLLQLSGHNPLLVLGDADVAAAARSAAYGSFVHQGQVCMCSRRIFVEEPVADAFTHAFVTEAQRLAVGDPRDPGVEIGPLINEWALALIERRVQEAVDQGASVLSGGRATGRCYPATVLTDVPPDCEIAREETFGPVAIVERVADAEAAVERANDSPWALSTGVITGDEGRGLRLARRLSAGMVHVNDSPVNDQPQMPFGGSLDSGWGRFGTGPGRDDFTEVQLVTSRALPRDPFPDR